MENNIKNPLVLTFSQQLFVGYKVNKPNDQSGEYVSKEVADKLLGALNGLMEWRAHFPQAMNPEIIQALSAIKQASE